MKLIASFEVDHDKLQKGMYISRVDGDVVTYDLRMKRPNKGDYLDNAVMHTLEHLFATYVRNTDAAEHILYFGPMGCRTGFYFLVRDALSHEQALHLTRDALRFITAFSGEIPGTASSRECGNYREHDLVGANRLAEEMHTVLADWTAERMVYDA